MLQLQVGGRRGTSSIQLSRLQPRPGRDAKEKVAESAQDYIGKGDSFQPRHSWTVLSGDAVQQYISAAAASSVPGCTGLPHHSGRNECPTSLEAQPPPSQSVQAPNVNSSSVNDMFKVVATVFQHIMTELNGAESEEGRIVAIIKIILKQVKF
jgi:hypothetical protein